MHRTLFTKVLLLKNNLLLAVEGSLFPLLHEEATDMHLEEGENANMPMVNVFASRLVKPAQLLQAWHPSLPKVVYSSSV